MPIVVNLDVMLARRKMRSKELAEHIGITEQNVSLLKSGKVKGIRFGTLDRICAVLNCQPAISWNIAMGKAKIYQTRHGLDRGHLWQRVLCSGFVDQQLLCDSTICARRDRRRLRW